MIKIDQTVTHDVAGDTNVFQRIRTEVPFSTEESRFLSGHSEFELPTRES